MVTKAGAEQQAIIVHTMPREEDLKGEVIPFDAPDLTDAERERCWEMTDYRLEGLEIYETNLHGFLDSLGVPKTCQRKYEWESPEMSILERIESLKQP